MLKLLYIKLFLKIFSQFSNTYYNLYFNNKEMKPLLTFIYIKYLYSGYSEAKIGRETCEI